LKKFEIMKNHFRIFAAFLTFALLISIHTVSVAQPPPPPDHGGGGNTPPGGGAGAPIGEGVFILLGLAGLYGGKKVYNIRKEVKSE
jgi:hypothetical protein